MPIIAFRARTGAPSKLPEVAEELIALLAAGEGVETAALRVGVTRASVENWLRWGEERPGSEFAEFVHRLQAAEKRAQPKLGARPRTKTALNAWLLATFGVRLPSRAVCDGHDAPLDVFWALFNNDIDEALVLGGRGGGKTELLALLHAANGYWKPGHTTTHFGSVENQAKRAYAHFERFCSSPVLKAVVPEVGKKRTTWKNGSEIEILPGTEKQTQGAHTFLVSWDELESGERQPYENARGIPMVDPQGNPGQFVTTSTRQKRGGLMQQALDDAPNRGARVFNFCVWETVMACKVPNRCKHTDVQHVDRSNKASYFCTQPLSKYTKGLNLAKADGWRPIEDVVATFRRMSEDAFETQVLNMRPERGSLIYAGFSEANVSELAEYVPGSPVLWAYDAGYNDDTWLGFLQLRGDSFYLFDEITGRHQSERHWIREGVKKVVALPDYKGPSYEEWEQVWNGKRAWPAPFPQVWPDASGSPEAGHFRFELKEHGVRAQSRKSVFHLLPDGQNVMRAAMESAGRRRFFVHPRCRVYIKSVGAFMARELPDGSYDEVPDPAPSNHKFSNALDGVRYLVWRWRKYLGLSASQEAADDNS